MNEQVKNVALDKRANSLLLKPPRKPTTTWGYGFTVSKARTDIEIVEAEKSARINFHMQRCSR